MRKEIIKLHKRMQSKRKAIFRLLGWFFLDRGKEPIPVPNLYGDREIENSWIISRLDNGNGNALDFGCDQGTYLGLIATRRGYNVTGINLTHVNWYYKMPNMRFIKGDIFKVDFEPEYFDLVINCSTIEHVGLAGRYGVVENLPDGDLDAMERLWNIMKPGAKMLLTIPVGQDEVFSFWHRVYGYKRLPLLLSKFDLIEKEFWKKDENNQWIMVDEKTALNNKAVQHCYGLGLFVLIKKQSKSNGLK